VPITTVAEWDGRPEVWVSATQLGAAYTATDARRIVAEWCEFFSAGPSAITHLAFTSRTPKRLFESLRGQTQLESLEVKWGDYAELEPLVGMRTLRELRLGGASSVVSLEPLRELTGLRALLVESLRHVRDLSPLGALRQLVDLEVGGDWTSPRVVHVDSIAFLRELPGLERLVLHTMIVDDLDYTPLLGLPNLTEVRVKRARGMRPTHDELCAAIPALEPLPR
jgi:hypothetical protein